MQVQIQTLLSDLSRSDSAKSFGASGGVRDNPLLDQARSALSGSRRGSAKNKLTGTQSGPGDEIAEAAQERRDKQADFADKLREKRTNDAAEQARKTNERQETRRSQERSKQTQLAEGELSPTQNSEAQRTGEGIASRDETGQAAAGASTDTRGVPEQAIAADRAAETLKGRQKQPNIDQPAAEVGADAQAATEAGAQTTAKSALIAPASKIGVQALVRQAARSGPASRDQAASASETAAAAGDGPAVRGATSQAAALGAVDQAVSGTFAETATQALGVQASRSAGGNTGQGGASVTSRGGGADGIREVSTVPESSGQSVDRAPATSQATQTTREPSSSVSSIASAGPGAHSTALGFSGGNSIFKLSIQSDVPGANAADRASPSARHAEAEAQRAFTSQVDRGVAAALSTTGGSATIRLFPPALGQLRIQVWLDRPISTGTGATGSGKGVSARFDVGSARARELLSGSIEGLRDALESKGLVLADVEVRVQPPLPERELGLPPLPIPQNQSTGSSEQSAGNQSQSFGSGSGSGTEQKIGLGLGSTIGPSFAGDKLFVGGAGEVWLDGTEGALPGIGRDVQGRLVVDALA